MSKRIVACVICFLGLVFLGAILFMKSRNATAGRAGAASLSLESKEKANYTLEHDFGIVRPGEKLSHVFPVRNDTRFSWKIRKFHSSCACAMGKAVRPLIPPGETEGVEVVYKAPASEGNDRRRITVEFAGSDAPLYVLIIRARIRDPLSIAPKVVEFPRLGKGRQAEDFLQIFNHTNRFFKLTSVQSNRPWLSVDQPILENGDKRSGETKQIWRVPLRASARNLVPGWHHAEVEIHASDATVDKKTVEVHLHVIEPIEASPTQIFFGTVPPRIATTRRLLLRFASEQIAPVNPADIILHHDLSDVLKLKCTRRTATCWELTGTIVPDRSEQIIKGTVEISFRTAGVPSLKIPICARVGEP